MGVRGRAHSDSNTTFRKYRHRKVDKREDKPQSPADKNVDARIKDCSHMMTGTASPSKQGNNNIRKVYGSSRKGWCMKGGVKEKEKVKRKEKNEERKK